MMIERKKKLVASLAPFIGEELTATLDPHAFHIRSDYCTEHAGYGTPASIAFLDAMFPRWPAPAKLLHYTKIANLRSVAESGGLWLFSMRNRINQGELKEFAKDHKLIGFYESTEGKPYYRHLADDLFYTSFAPDCSNEDKLWREFAGGGTGVRLKMRLSPKYAELRPIQYAAPMRTALMKLNDDLANLGLPPFVPWTISKIGGFYLQANLRDENEVRLLAKRHIGGPNEARKQGNLEFWPIPVGATNKVCDIELLGIELGPAADRLSAEDAVAGTPFASVPII